MAKTYKRICGICSKPFSGRQPHAKYCGKTCRTEADRRAKNASNDRKNALLQADGVVPCEMCGEVFARRLNRIRFCSTQCKSDFKKVGEGKALDNREVTEFMLRCVARDLAKGYSLEQSVSQNSKDFIFNKTFFRTRVLSAIQEQGERWDRLIKKYQEEERRIQILRELQNRLFA